MYAIVEGYFIKKDALDMDLAGADALMLGITGIFYFLMVFLVEYLKTIPSVFKFFT